MAFVGVAIVLIWAHLDIDCSRWRFSGMLTNWLGFDYVASIACNDNRGLRGLVQSGTTVHLPFLPGGAEVNFSNTIAGV